MYPYGGYPPKKSTPQYPQQSYATTPNYPSSGSYGSVPTPGFQGAYPSQQQYPQQSYPVQSYGSQGYQQPTIGYPQWHSSPYPTQSGQYPSNGYPSQLSKYLAPVSYPQQAQGSYAAQQRSGYSPQPAGYPPQSQPGYPPQHPQQSLGYPLQQVQAGYPPQQQQQFLGYPAPTAIPPQQVQSRPPPQSQVQSSSPPQPSKVQSEQQPAADLTPMSTGTQVEGTVHPAKRFNANADAEAVRKAMKGLGCDSKAVLNILCHRSNAQRQKIQKKFKIMYGEDLISELGRNFENFIVVLLYLPEEFDARELQHAMDGPMTNGSTLIEIMVTRTNAEINAIKACYRQLYGKDLEQALTGETVGHFKRFLVSLSTGDRDESTDTDPARAAAQAQELYEAGKTMGGTTESIFNATIVANNPAQLQLIFDEYIKLSGHDIEKAIEKEFSGDVVDGLTAVVKSVKNKPAYFAERAYKSMIGLEANDQALIRVIVSRCEKDMVQIKEEYQRMYKTTLESDIAGDTSDKFKEGLLTLVRGNH